MHIIRIELHLLHRLVVEGLEGHRVGITVQVECLALLNHLFEKLLALLLNLELFLELQLELHLFDTLILGQIRLFIFALRAKSVTK